MSAAGGTAGERPAVPGGSAAPAAPAEPAAPGRSAAPGATAGPADAAARPDPDDEAPPEASPLGVEPEPTGNGRVDALLERLTDADALPTEDHLAVYEDVHRGLRDTLTALDTPPGPPGPAPSGTHDRR